MLLSPFKYPSPMTCQYPNGYLSDRTEKCTGMELFAVSHVTAWTFRQQSLRQVRKSKQIEMKVMSVTQTQTSIVGVSTMCLEAFSASATHAVHQVSDTGLGEIVPLFL